MGRAADVRRFGAQTAPRCDEFAVVTGVELALLGKSQPESWWQELVGVTRC